jgi:tetratricopeptide (TPR) repeat protein
LLGAIAEGPLLRVAASGGRPEPATRAGPGELHRFPSLLPDGRHFLFGALKVADQRVELRVGSLDQVEISRRLLEATSCARFAPPNRIVYSLDEALLAQELDLHRLETVGAPVLLSDRPEDRQGYLSQPRVDVAADGSMLYLNRDERPGELVWLDRQGKEFNARGNAYSEIGELDHAMEDYTSTIGLRPDYASAYFNRGLIYAGRGDLARAKRDFDLAVRVPPKTAWDFNIRGAAYLEKRDRGRALADFTHPAALRGGLRPNHGSVLIRARCSCSPGRLVNCSIPSNSTRSGPPAKWISIGRSFVRAPVNAII